MIRENTLQCLCLKEISCQLSYRNGSNSVQNRPLLPDNIDSSSKRIIIETPHHHRNSTVPGEATPTKNSCIPPSDACCDSTVCSFRTNKLNQQDFDPDVLKMSLSFKVQRCQKVRSTALQFLNRCLTEGKYRDESSLLYPNGKRILASGDYSTLIGDTLLKVLTVNQGKSIKYLMVGTLFFYISTVCQ